MLFKSVPFVLALLAAANAAPGSSSLLHHKKCDVSVMKQFDIANGTDVIISEDPLVPFVSPKISAVNETAWESWFFDATADDGETGIGIMFWRDNSHVGEVNPPFGVLRLQTQVTFSNGSSWIEVSWVTDNTISTCKNSTTGVWSKPGYRYSFDISSDLKYTTIVLDSPTLKGTYTLTATAPAVYADGNQWPSKNASPQVKPWVYWEAPVTAGKVAVDFDIDGTRLNFTGVGGHDRNWGPFPLSVSSLGWQIGRVFAGPYTAVFWRIGSSVDGKTYLASVLIKSGEVIFSTRNLGVVKRGDYLLFSQTHVNHTGTPFDPSKARTTFTLDFTSAKKKKNWKFDVNFADPEWALGERGFGGFVPAQIKGGEVGCEVFSGIGTAMHAEFDDAWV